MTFKAIIIRAAGTNCDGETATAIELAGGEADRVHVNRVADAPHVLDEASLLVFAGGFTFGDDVASGAVFSHTLEHRLRDPLEKFVGSGRAVLGICNGFQVLVRLGFLPGSLDGAGPAGRGALLDNLSGRFEDRWVHLRAGARASLWLEPAAEYLMPVAHAEGRFEWFPASPNRPFPDDQVALRYLDPASKGDPDGAAYPWNPNGSHRDIAGIVNPEGNVLGLMPHPERFVRSVHHPFWTRFRGADGSPPGEQDLPVPLGLDLFRRVVRELPRSL